jgi:glutaredoxin
MSYTDHIETVDGDKTKELMLFTLSTCIWCMKTKALLKELGKGYDFVDVDLLEAADKDEAYAKMWEFDKSTSFPTVIVNGGDIVLHGFAEDDFRSL